MSEHLRKNNKVFEICFKYQILSMITVKLCGLKEKLGFDSSTTNSISTKKENQENDFLRRTDESNVNVLDNSLQSLGGVEAD